ncbi:hypothetical protein [Caballeronia sp. RCC_10]|uniref:hypothetical protein n=1 Tax=Caballeronia sp. RCC_10 TaxID=3239227 RepID=UPI00352694FE
MLEFSIASRYFSAWQLLLDRMLAVQDVRYASCSTGVAEPRGSEDVGCQRAWKVIQGSFKLSATAVLRSGQQVSASGQKSRLLCLLSLQRQRK